MISAVIILAAAILSQTAPENAKALIEKLRLDNIQERDEATAKLEAMGKAAEAELEKAAGDDDGEVASRAKRLLKIIDVEERITPGLRKEIPDAIERLLSGEGSVWTDVFFESISGRAGAALKPEDREPLVAGAVRGAATAQVKRNLIFVVVQHAPGAAGEIVCYLKDESEIVRLETGALLIRERPQAAVGALTQLLKDESAETRRSAVACLTAIDLKGTIGEVSKLAADADEKVRAVVIDALAAWGSKDAVPALKERLSDGSPKIRAKAAGVLAAVAGREGGPALTELLKDPEEEVRQAAETALRRLEQE